jgi:hypothetical protein
VVRSSTITTYLRKEKGITVIRTDFDGRGLIRLLAGRDAEDGNTPKQGSFKITFSK